MKKDEVIQALSYARQLSKPRKFEQSVELVINFKGIDFKKADNRIDVDVTLPHATGKQGNIKTLVFVKDNLFAQDIKNIASKVIKDEEIPNLKKKDIELLIRDYNVFLAEGPTMLTVGKYLGQQLAPKGRMPKPIIASVSAFEQSLKNVSTSTKVTNKKGRFMPVVHVMIGKEGFKDEQLADNINEVYRVVSEALPGKDTNIKSILIKLTMGKPVKIGVKYDKKESQNDVSKEVPKGEAK
ncbi:MAG: hypothetical protein NUV57_06475 [archaeon]|nr:hypothetical protein [archaeon]